MPHLDPDALALAALGEPLDARDRAHLQACTDCSQERDALATAVVAGRAGGGERLVPPPAAVWERVSAELGLDAGVQPAPAMPGAAPRDPAAPAPARPGRRGRRLLLVAAAALVVGGVAGGLVVAAVLRTDPETVLAEARLEALPGWSASGDAIVEEDAAGRLTLVVRVSATDEDGFRAVWLLDEDASRLVNLGALDGDEGRFAIPPGLDLREFPVVDVSAEPYDGDPAHSGDSIVRGALDPR